MGRTAARLARLLEEDGPLYPVELSIDEIKKRITGILEDKQFEKEFKKEPFLYRFAVILKVVEESSFDPKSALRELGIILFDEFAVLYNEDIAPLFGAGVVKMLKLECNAGFNFVKTDVGNTLLNLGYIPKASPGIWTFQSSGPLFELLQSHKNCVFQTPVM